MDDAELEFYRLYKVLWEQHDLFKARGMPEIGIMVGPGRIQDTLPETVPDPDVYNSQGDVDVCSSI